MPNRMQIVNIFKSSVMWTNYFVESVIIFEITVHIFIQFCVSFITMEMENYAEHTTLTIRYFTTFHILKSAWNMDIFCIQKIKHVTLRKYYYYGNMLFRTWACVTMMNKGKKWLMVNWLNWFKVRSNNIYRIL